MWRESNSRFDFSEFAGFYNFFMLAISYFVITDMVEKYLHYGTYVA